MGEEELRRELAAIRDRIGDVYMQTSRFTEALEEYEQALALLQSVAGESPTPRSTADSAIAERKIGFALTLANRSAEAEPYLASSVDRLRVLAELDPDNAGWLNELGMSLVLLGDVANDTGQPDRALVSWTEANQLLTSYLAEHTDARTVGRTLDEVQARLDRAAPGSGSDSSLEVSP